MNKIKHIGLNKFSKIPIKKIFSYLSFEHKLQLTSNVTNKCIQKEIYNNYPNMHESLTRNENLDQEICEKYLMKHF